MVRAFFALLLKDDLRRALEELLLPFQRKGEPVRWVAAGNTHVTIRFLGDITMALRTEVEESVEASIESVRPFRFALGSPGAFPSMKSPRVLWIGASRGAAEITSLAQVVEEAIDGLGFEREKRFHPHITVGRTKRRPSAGFLNRFGAIDVPPLEQETAVLHLMKSTLTPRGAVYEVLREFPLRYTVI